MAEQNISQEFRLKNINETRNYFIEGITQNKLICKKHKKICKASNYIEPMFILGSAVTGRVFIPALIGIPIATVSSTKLCNNCRY